jgi:hypothetical protein
MTEREFSDLHNEVWNQLPWYINQTLSTEEDAVVEKHLSSCLVCRNELVQQRALKEVVISEDSEKTAAIRSLSALHQRIQATNDQSASPQWLAWLQNIRNIVQASHIGIQTTLAAQAAVIMIAIVFTIADKPAHSDSDSFQTLTSEATGVESSAHVFNVIFAEDLTVFGLQKLLEDLELNIISGPSPAGAYELSAVHSTVTTADRFNKVLADLQNHPKIRFATQVK